MQRNSEGVDWAIAGPRLFWLSPIFSALVVWIAIGTGQAAEWSLPSSGLTALVILGLMRLLRCRLCMDALLRRDFAAAWAAVLRTPEYRADGYKLPIGENVIGRRWCINIAQSGNILVGATTGYGKSNLLRCLVKRAIESSEIDTVTLIDLKMGVEFSEFASEVKVSHFASTPSEAFAALFAAKVHAEARLKTLPDAGLREWVGPLRIIVIDEVAGLARDRACSALFEWLVNQGRAAGYRIIAATQQPSVDVLPSLIRQGFDTRIALHTATDDHARTILGSLPDHARFDTKRLRKGRAVALYLGKFYLVSISATA